MSYPNPLGYWVSCQELHPAATALKQLETWFSDQSRLLETQKLRRLLTYCAASSDPEGWWLARRNTAFESEIETKLLDLLDQLDEALLFALVPFLHEQIKARGDK